MGERVVFFLKKKMAGFVIVLFSVHGHFSAGIYRKPL